MEQRISLITLGVHDLATLHSLQSCKPGARVLDEYSTYPTAPRVWGWVSGCPTLQGALQGSPHTLDTRRPAWHVESTHRARLWRFLAYLNRAISALPVSRRRMNGSCRSDTVLRSPRPSRRHRQSSPRLSNLLGGGMRYEYDSSGDLRPRLV
jgi:hypothetical protein